MNPFPDRLYFNLIFAEPPNALWVWNHLVDFLEKDKHLPQFWQAMPSIIGDTGFHPSTDRLKLASSEVASLLKQVPQDKFWVDTGHSSRSVGFSLLHQRLCCRVEAHAKAPDNWAPLLESLMTELECVGAWQWKHLYRVWQSNNEYYSGYESRFGSLPPGCSVSHQPSIDGIGPGQHVIDMSQFPGRPKHVAPEIVFHLTAEMWLGPHFWPYAKCTKEEALAADFWLETRDTPNYTYFKCWPTPFTRPDGEQGRMQQRLWKLFFHEDCEWPPGSGTICDEPMYGPPELMPQSPENRQD